MDFKKRKRSERGDVEGEAEDEERPKAKCKRELVVMPSPPSPPGDSNDREVSMILSQEEAKQTGHYSQNSSLLTDLSLTPSPPGKNRPPPQDSISTPLNLSEHDQIETCLESDSLEEAFTDQPDTQQPAVYKKPENPQNSFPKEEPSTCLEIREDQEENTEAESSPAKASSINNNSRSVEDVILTCVTSPPYSSPSPVYSIPSPGSAFSIVISKRRDSES